MDKSGFAMTRRRRAEDERHSLHRAATKRLCGDQERRLRLLQRVRVGGGCAGNKLDKVV